MSQEHLELGKTVEVQATGVEHSVGSEILLLQVAVPPISLNRCVCPM